MIIVTLIYVKWYLIVVLISISMLISDMEHLSISFWLFVCLQWINVCSSIFHFKLFIFCFAIELLELFIFWILILYFWLANTFCLFILCLFMVLFTVQKVFCLVQTHLFMSVTVAYAFGVILKKSLPRQSHETFPLFSSRTFLDSCLSLKPLIHLELTFLHML